MHWASSLLLAAPASAAAPLCTGEETALPRLPVQLQELRPDSKPGLATRLVAALALWATRAPVTAIKPAAARAVRARNRDFFQDKAHLSHSG